MSTLSVHSTSSSSSESTSPLPSPALTQLHHPELAARVEVPHDVEPLAPGVSAMNGKALLAKKMAASGLSFYSPTDNLVSPCTAKLHLTKQMRFAKMSKPAKPALLSANSFPAAVGSEHSQPAFVRPASKMQTSQGGDQDDAESVHGLDENRPPALSVGDMSF